MHAVYCLPQPSLSLSLSSSTQPRPKWISFVRSTARLWRPTAVWAYCRSRRERGPFSTSCWSQTASQWGRFVYMYIHVCTYMYYTCTCIYIYMYLPNVCIYSCAFIQTLLLYYCLFHQNMYTLPLSLSRLFPSNVTMTTGEGRRGV